MPHSAKKPEDCTVSAKRQRRYLGQLAARDRKRLPVDLAAEDIDMIEALMEGSYAPSQGVVMCAAP